MIADKIADIDLRALLSQYGIELKHQRQGRHIGLCPLHADSNPSFYVYTDKPKHQFKCFGCGAHGDAVDFIRLYHGCDMAEALRRLEIKPDIDPQQKQYVEKKRQGVEQFDHWRRLMVAALTELISKAETTTLEQAIEFPLVIDAVQKWRYWLSILTDGGEKEQIEFYFSAREKLDPIYNVMKEREQQPKAWVCMDVNDIRVGSLVDVHG